MAIPASNEPEEVQDAEQYALAQSYYQLSLSQAWKDLCDLMTETVDKAQQEHFSSREVDPLKIIEEKLRWQQRILIQQLLVQRVASFLKLRNDLIEESAEQEKPHE